jgi:hypothetical protein
MSGQRVRAEQDDVLRPLDRPDPSSVGVPRPEVASSDDYFYFYKTGVSYQRAFSDLDECRMYSLQAQLTPVPPKFIPLGSAAVKSEGTARVAAQFGLVGLLVIGPIIESGEEDAAEASNRRCMMYKGYSRFGTSRASWKQIKAGTEAERLARLALIASVPPPSAGAIGP